MIRLVSVSILCFLMTSISQAVPSKVIFGIDCSRKMLQGHFGSKDYGTNLFAIDNAFANPKKPNSEFGPDQQSPLSWALQLAMPAVRHYEFDARESFYSIGYKDGYDKKKVLNLLDLSERVNSSSLLLESNTQVVESIKTATDLLNVDGRYGNDFNPIPFMKLAVGQLHTHAHEQLTLAVIFCTGDMEDTKREELKQFIIDTSYLPIKWAFLVIGKGESNKEIQKVIDETSRERLFENAKTFNYERYFDFDGLINVQFDISESMTRSTKLYEDLDSFLERDYNSKILKLLKARATTINCQESLGDILDIVE